MSSIPCWFADHLFNFFFKFSSLLEYGEPSSMLGGRKEKEHGGGIRRGTIISCKNSKKIEEGDTVGGYYLIYSCK